MSSSPSQVMEMRIEELDRDPPPTTAAAARVEDEDASTDVELNFDDLVMDAEDLARLQGMDHLNYDDTDFDLAAEYQRPSMQVALENRKFHMPTKRDGSLYSVWGTKTGRFVNKRVCCIDCFGEGHRSELIAFGSGISAYFKLLKSMTILTLILGLLSLPLLYININGGDYFKHHPVPFVSTTLGNLHSGYVVVDGVTLPANSTLLPLIFPSLCTAQVVAAGACPFDANDLLLLYCIWDGMMMLIFFFSINVFYRFTYNESSVYKRKIPKIEDYSVQISVPLGADATGIQAHFERGFHANVKVYDVQIVERTGNSIAICVQRGKLLKRLARLDATGKMLASEAKPGPQTDAAIARNKKQQDEVAQHITDLDLKAMKRVEGKEGKRALFAFVTFQSQEAKLRVLDEYENDHTCCGQAARLKYEGESRLVVKPAPPPSTLLWENQEIGRKTNCARTTFAFLIFAAILALTAALSFVTDQNRAISSMLNDIAASGPTTSEFCEGRYSNFSDISQQAFAAKLNNDQPCYCDNLGNNPLNRTSEADDIIVLTLCNDYLGQRMNDLAREVGFSFMVIVINMVIYKVVLLVAKNVMKYRNVLDREHSIMRVIFVITLINTGLIILLVNTDWERLSGQPFITVRTEDGTVFVKTGDFVDFEPEWYSKVGIEILILSVLNIVGPYVLPIVRFAVHMVERKFVSKHAISQQRLNDLFLGEEFLLSVRLAQTLTMVFFSLAFSSGVPLLYWTCFLSFIVAYWFDKFFFLRLARTPPQFDTNLQEWALRTLEWAVVIHCLFGFWMYSSPRMFPDDTQSFSLFTFSSGDNNPTMPPTTMMSYVDPYAPPMPTQSPTKMPTPAPTQTRWGANSSDTFGFAEEFMPRFERSGPVLLLFVGAFVLAFKFLRRFSKSFCGCTRSCCHSCLEQCRYACGVTHRNPKLNKNIMSAEKFHIMLAKKRVAGVTSYNILANPVYQVMFQMQHEETDLEASRSGFHSLQDALNIRKETAVNSIHARSLWTNSSSALADKHGSSRSVRSNKNPAKNATRASASSSVSELPVQEQEVKRGSKIIAATPTLVEEIVMGAAEEVEENGEDQRPASNARQAEE